MSEEHHQDNKTKEATKVDKPEEAISLLKKRLIWQHLTQKKIRKGLREKLKIGGLND